MPVRSRPCPLIGAHMSIAGGYERAIERAASLGMETCQIFTKNNNQWRAKPISQTEEDRFRTAFREHQIRNPIAHASYLINLATPDGDLWTKSVDALAVELTRCEQLGIGDLVVHPGAFTSSNEEDGVEQVCRALDEVHRRLPKIDCRTLLETTAGQGSSLGWRFEQLAAMLAGVREPHRLGICFDTCHAFAAGYPLAPRPQFLATFRHFDKIIGIQQLKAFHLNDSKRELGSRVDRHEHIGLGKLGKEPFALLLRDRRFRKIPMYLETPKGEKNGKEWDVVNLQVLRELSKA